MIRANDITQTWITGEGHAVKSHTTGNRFGLIVGVGITISSVTGAPNSAITFRDADGQTIIPDALCAVVAHNTKTFLLALSHKAVQDANFNPAPVSGPITVAIDPSADAGGAAQTLTVKVRLFIQD